MSLRLFLTGLLALACVHDAGAEQVRLVSDDLPEALREQLVEALPTEDAAETPLEARRQARRAAERLRNVLNSQGYLDPSIDFAVEGAEPPIPLVRIDPGQRFRVSTVELDFADPAPEPDAASAARSALSLRENDVAFAAKVLDQPRRIIAALRLQGYPDASADSPDVLGDRENALVDVTFPVTTGRRARFGTLQIEGADRTSRDYIARLSPIEEGQVYMPGQLDTLNARLGETRLFTLASARLAPEESSVVGPDGYVTRDIIVSLQERPRHTIALGGSLSNVDGIGANARWVRRNLTGRGDSLEVEATVAELTRALDAVWRRPNQFGYGRSLAFNAGISDETTDAFDRRAVVVGAAVDVDRNPRLTYGLAASLEATTETTSLGERNIQVARVGGAVRVDQSDSVLDPKSGWRADLSVTPTYGFGDTVSQYVRATGQVSAYLPLGPQDQFVLAGRARAGGALGAGVFDIPVGDRFYAGGGGSVRGFAYQAIGPRDPVTNAPTGNRYLLEGSLEARARVRDKISVAAFADAGNVASSTSALVDDIRVGAGLGVRYDTAIGPIRLDVATPLDRRSGEDSVLLYISIGQAF